MGWGLGNCSTHTDSKPFHSIRAVVSPVCIVSSCMWG